MSKYNIHKPKGAPEWFVPGIECEVSDNERRWVKRVLIWYEDGQNFPFLAEDRYVWRQARPIEQWEPVEGEEVLGFDDNGANCIGKFVREEHYEEWPFKLKNPAGSESFEHIARLQYPDGRVTDVTGGIEAIKKRTYWL